MHSLSKEEFFSNFKVLRKIGEGGCGSVFKIMSKNGEFFALKSIVCQNLDHLSAAMHEILILSGLKSQAVVKIFSYFMDKKPEQVAREAYILGIIMELAEFSLFDDFCQRKTLQRMYSKEAVYQILHVFVELFSELQGKNIAHRDIKPENILLTKNGLRLTDFGLAKNTENGQIRSNMYAGSPYYVSPLLREAVKNKEKLMRLDHDVYKSDVFSLGLILLEAASLCDIRGMNSFGNRGKVQEIINKLAIEYDPWFINVLKIMLEFEEEKRPNFIQLKDLVKKEEDLRYLVNPFVNFKQEKNCYHNVLSYVQESEEKIEEKNAEKIKKQNENKEKVQESESFVVKKHNNSTYLQEKLGSNGKSLDLRGKESAFFEELLQKTHKKQEKMKIFFEDQTQTKKIFVQEKAQPILLQEHKLISPQENNISQILVVLRLYHHENQYFITSGEGCFDVFLIENSYPSKFFHSIQRYRDSKIRINALEKFQVITSNENNKSLVLHSFVLAGTSCSKIIVFKLSGARIFNKLFEYQEKHKKAITAMSFSHKHQLLAVGSSDFCVRLLQIDFEKTSPDFLQISQTGHVFTGHCGVITSVFFCEDQIISSSADSLVFVWRFIEKTSDRVVKWDCDWISCMKVCESKGKYKAFCGSGNKGVAVFHIDSGERDTDYEYFDEIFTEWISFIDYSEEFDILIVCEGKGKIVLIHADHRRKILNFEDEDSDISGAVLVKNVKNQGFILIVTHFDGKIKYLQISEFPIPVNG